MEDKVIPVKVAVRGRPLVDKELSEGCQSCIMFVPSEGQIVVGKDKSFGYDFVYPPSVGQEPVYREAVVPLVNGLFKGYNATVLAYGQTGSGKTYTMGGAYGVCMDGVAEITGVIPRVVLDLFEGIQKRKDQAEFTVKITYFEIYKEDLLDLLVPTHKRDKDQVTIREDGTGGIKLIGLTEVEVQTAEDIFRHLVEGSHGRTVGATAMNNQSSRSHAIFTIYLERKSKTDSNDFYKAKFHLVDLAGSERIKKTLAEGERMKEGININRGLLALGNVISALGDEDRNKKAHIPYRDSKLTRLLQDSLGGNSHTLMIACISPADSNMEETISTLRYADRARKIKNKPIVNRDPQLAEILRLRQLVLELQCGKLPSTVSVKVEGDKGITGFQELVERNKKLENDNHKLANELQSAISQNTEITEKFVRSELTREQLRAQLQDLKATTGMSITQLLNATRQGFKEDGVDQTSCTAEAFEQQLSIMKEVHEKIGELEENNNGTVGMVSELDNGTESQNADSPVSEEVRNRHVLRQAQLSRELQELNKMLERKQELAGQMQVNDVQMQAMKTVYETQMKDLETEVNTLQKEKEDLNQALQSAKTTSNCNKLAEQRRKRLQELEGQIGELKRKMSEQSKMLKLKEQTDKQVEKLNSEILLMKQQRVKLMNQIKDDAEQFRKLRSEMAKEVLQLKSQDRKRVAEIARLERQHVNQQAVLRRKAEEAAAANNKLKEVLLRQKLVADERTKKQETADLSGIGARVRKMLNEELDFLVSVEEGRLHLANQITSRKEINEQLNLAKKKVEALQKKGAASSSDQETVNELQQQLDICSTQIADLQQKLLDADQDEKGKSRWSNIHTMVEAKCAMKWLLNVAVGNKVECLKKDGEIADVKTCYEEQVKLFEAAEEELKQLKVSFETELHALRKECESKVLYLMTQLRSVPSSMSAETIDSDLRKRIHFQEAEIARLAHLDEELSNKDKECALLRKELTKIQYNRTFGREGSLMPADLESNSSTVKDESTGFLSPIFIQQSKRRKTFGKASESTAPVVHLLPVIDDEDSQSDDSEDDPEWVSGQTPMAFQNRVSRINRAKNDSDEVNCKCKTQCSTKRCNCHKSGKDCAENCSCSSKCLNKPSHLIKTLDDDSENAANQTFTKDTSSRKRVSDDKKDVSDDDFEKSGTVDSLSASGINALGKKRRLLAARQSYFGDV